LTGEGVVHVFLCDFSIFEDADFAADVFWDQLHEYADDDPESAYSHTKEVLHEVEWYHLDEDSSILDQGELHQDGDDLHEPEHPIIAEVGEGVERSEVQLPSVDRVEDLHEHESLEEDCQLDYVRRLN
jgi:hypothetical protein